MKLTILQENLAKAVSTASRFASAKAQLPILGNILISSKKTKILVSSTNLEVSVSVAVGAKVEEEGEISVPAKVASELIDNLPHETLDISSEKEQLKVSTSGFSSTVLGINSSDFPKIPNTVNRESSISIPKNEIAKALSQVSFAASVDETRPVLTGVLFLFESNKLSLVATDGFRLSRKNLKVAHDGEVGSVIIPKMVLSELSRSGEGDEVLMEVKEKEKQIVFGIGDTVLASRLLEGEYPDFEKIIPKKAGVEILVDKEEFARAVKLSSVFARDGANIVKIKILKESLKISAESGNSGSQEAKVDAKITAASPELAEGEISFNFRFLEDFIHSVGGEEIKMEFSGPNAPGLFTDTSDASYLHLIMPVKTQG